jgi:maltose-binding protein MalE
VSAYQGSLVDLDGNFLWRQENVLKVLGRFEPLWRRPAAWKVCREDAGQSLQLQLFAEGKLASFIAGPGMLAALEQTGRPFAVIPIPPPADAPHAARALVGYQCLVVLRDSRWVDLALEVGTRLLRDEVNERLNRQTRRLPVLVSLYQSKQAMASAGAFGFLRALEEGQLFPPAANWSEGFQKAENRLERLRRLAQPPRVGELARLLAGGES